MSSDNGGAEQSEVATKGMPNSFYFVILILIYIHPTVTSVMFQV